MDVFQIVTLCSLLAVMFIGVTSYGLFRNWQRNQLELDLAQAPDREVKASDWEVSEVRVYPRNASRTQGAASLGTRDSATQAATQSFDAALSRSDLAGLRATRPGTQTRSDTPSSSWSRPVVAPSQQTNKTGKSNQPAVQTELNLGTSDETPTVQPVKGSSESRLSRKSPKRTKRTKAARDTKKNGSFNAVASKNKTALESETDFVAIFVIGEHDMAFRMDEISRFLLAKGLQLDSTGLFCQKDRTTGEVVFKVANVYFPGTFDTQNIENTRTEGISFVMKLSMVAHPVVVFEQMHAIANACSEKFSGTLKDENFNKLSNQTLAHYRHRVSVHHRKQLTING